MTVSSSSTDDVATTGTGAWTLRTIGLNSSWVEVVQDVSLNGQTAVALPTSLIRLYRAYVLTAGTGGVNAGDVWIGSGTVTNGVPANKYAGVLANNGQTLMAVYSIPTQASNGRLYNGGQIVRWYVRCGAIQNAFGTAALQTREFGQSWRTRRIGEYSQTGPFDEDITWGIDLQSKSDIRVRVLSNNANNTTVSAGFDIALRQKV
jgi:hypothetical protein